MICYIKINSTNKAKADIDTLMHNMQFNDLSVKGPGSGSVETFFRKVFSGMNLLFQIHKGDILIIQYPFKKFYKAYCRMAHLKGAKTITLIHDLGTFRRKKLTAEQEINRLNKTDYIIAHNEKMKTWLEEHGCKCPIGCLTIFDYLSDAEPIVTDYKPPFNHVAYAGGLFQRKNAFLYQLGEALNDCSIDLYGKGDIDFSKISSNVKSHGRIAPDEFVRNTNADWGLVWDGDSVNGCGGIWGDYLKINNPHKTSFYLRAGLPVIVWKESAVAPFIIQNNLGIAIDSLNEVPEIINNYDASIYNEIKNNVRQIKTQLQSGYYFSKAINEALQVLEK